MNCQEYWNTLPEPGQMENGHLAECPACTLRMQRRLQLHAGLRAMAESEVRLAAPARVEGRLLKAFRQHEGLPARRISGRWAPVLGWAAAIAAMLLLGVFLVRNRQPEPARVASPHSLELAAADPAGQFEGFIPLPNSPGLISQGEGTENEDEVNLVRVSVPRSAMLALGLDVSEDRAGEMVEADIMLGSDGVARAVRFLDTEGLLD